MVGVVAKKIMSLLLFFVNLLRRLMCFLGRRRRNSGMILPMTTPGLDSSHNHTQSVPSSVAEPFVMESWDNWGDESNQNNLHGHGHGHPSQMAPSHHHNAMSQEEEEPPEPDYFNDMMPQFKRPTRIVLKKTAEEDHRTNKFNLNADLTYQAPGLGTWDEGENAWEGDLDDDLVSQAELVMREKKRQERERRLAEHQKKKLDRDVQRTGVQRDPRLGVRLS